MFLWLFFIRLCCLAFFINLIAAENSHAQSDFWQPSGLDTIITNIIANEDEIFATTPIGTYHSTNHGQSWAKVSSISPNAIAINSEGHLIAGTYSNPSLYLFDGVSWIKTAYADGPIGVVAVNSSDHIYAGSLEALGQPGRDGVLRSKDGGTTWDLLLPLTEPRLIVFNGDGYTFVSDWSSVLYRSVNDGENWEIIELGNAWHIWGLAFNSEGEAFATSPRGLFRSTDNGTTWMKVSSESVRWITITQEDHIYTGNTEVFASIDGGDTWTKISSGLIASQITSLTTDSRFVFAGTSAGIFRSVTPVTSVSQSEAKLELSFQLHQNYPNPFNAATTIEYELAKREQFVTIEIFNFRGQNIRTLVNETSIPAGTYSVQWDGTTDDGNLVGSGLYLYKITTGKFSTIKKALLLK